MWVRRDLVEKCHSQHIPRFAPGVALSTAGYLCLAVLSWGGFAMRGTLRWRIGIDTAIGLCNTMDGLGWPRSRAAGI